MFDRPHHQRIASVLECVDASLMREAHSLFGGGTVIALSKGEYRESVDIDFICDSIDGYRDLRGRVHERGIHALVGAAIPLVREPSIDQYGIRCAFLVDAKPIKFEIVFEGLVQLSDPDRLEDICGVSTLRLEDRVATKLMANSDRWADDSVMSRDIIDLAMLTDTGELAPAGVAKAMTAYGDSVLKDLEKAKAHVLDREGRLKQCIRILGIQLPLEDLHLRISRLNAQDPSLARAPARVRPSRASRRGTR